MAKTSPESYMLRAIELSRRGFPAPNPHVGCVVVRDGEIVGEGWHEYWGGPHAEAIALIDAGDRAKGADVYVSLEPCNHFGRRGPCSQALIEAKVARVFVAVRDPNPVAAGGAESLRGAGVEVTIGLCESEASAANRVFLTAIRRGRPFVLAKAAVTRDGFLARADGNSMWITGEMARARARQLRAEMGSVLVGIGTILADDPLLSHRIPELSNPCVRVVLDRQGRLPVDAKLFNEPGDVYQVLGLDATAHPRAIALRFPATEGLFDLDEVLKGLYERGVKGVLVEGGATTLTGFFESGLVDELALFQAPVEFKDGVRWLQTNVDPKLIQMEHEQIEQDIFSRFMVG